MTLPSFFLTYDVHAKKTLSAFSTILQSTPKKVISEVTIGELCSMTKYPHGLYFFYDENQQTLQYIGKCTSKTFIERIPSHLDQRYKEAWFNTLPRKLTEKNGVSYIKAHARALQFHVLLLGIKDADVTSKLEKIFRHSYEPKLNTPKNLQQFNDDRSLKQLVLDLQTRTKII